MKRIAYTNEQYQKIVVWLGEAEKAALHEDAKSCAFWINKAAEVVTEFEVRHCLPWHTVMP